MVWSVGFVDNFRGLQGDVITKQGVVHYAGLVIASVAILAVPAPSNLIVNEVLRARYPVPGAFYSVNGRPMHLHCTGYGFPTVVLDAGGGNDWLIWQKVQPEVAKTKRVCSYDRAGTGCSELQPGVQDANNIVMQLRWALAVRSAPTKLGA